MSYLYVCEQGASIGIKENRFQVKYKDGLLKSVPAETLEVIEVFGKIQITTQCLTECFNYPCKCTAAAKTGGSWKKQRVPA